MVAPLMSTAQNALHHHFSNLVPEVTTKRIVLKDLQNNTTKGVTISSAETEWKWLSEHFPDRQIVGKQVKINGEFVSVSDPQFLDNSDILYLTFA
jgi:hypothetical protein